MTGHAANSAPSAWVARFAGLVRPGGPVLDLACGSGRHTRLFLDLGHPGAALDRDIRRRSFHRWHFYRCRGNRRRGFFRCDDTQAAKP